MGRRKLLLKIYKRMYEHFGPRHWWPADTPLEVMVGAILTQNTSWKNVEKAISNLKERKSLALTTLHGLNTHKLATIIKPAGFYNIKAKRLKNFVNFLFLRYNSDIKKMFSIPLRILRKELLAVEGIGPETADSILLYAAKKPIFVIDNYTKRIFLRHKLTKKKSEYGNLQRLFMDSLPHRASLFNEYHALLVEIGKNFCKKKPLCEKCPLKGVNE